MTLSTLCFCLTDDQVLLAMKKRGFGAGKWNGYGGKVQAGETPRIAALRELTEESGLVAAEKDLQQVAIVNFYFEGKHVFECHVYRTYSWQNEPVETEEMRPRWFPMNKIPFDEMWAADAKWLPLILAGQTIKADINFTAEGTKVKEFTAAPAHFD